MGSCANPFFSSSIRNSGELAKMKRMHYLKKGLNISLLIAFTGIYTESETANYHALATPLYKITILGDRFLYRLHLFQKIFVETAA